MDPNDVEVKMCYAIFLDQEENNGRVKWGRVRAAGAYCPVHSTYHLSIITWIGGNYMFNELAVGTQSLAVGVAAYPDWSEAPFVGK
ncbi:hypothetical protein CK203_069914 [Vitis vinifera]|uniref:Uncharacterized protein n=1 Tax=Vitis vinifera TaxID=29760 RepID=A0A438EPY4_VITVI|nr:hypothetical protein CK203_069914 [Vitis vinifera]